MGIESYENAIAYVVTEEEVEQSFGKRRLLLMCSNCGFVADEIVDHYRPDGLECEPLCDWYHVYARLHPDQSSPVLKEGHQ